MFRQLVTPNPPASPLNNINSLFTYHPLQLSALVETVWFNRNNAASSDTSTPFVPWPPQFAFGILNTQFYSGFNFGTNPPTPLQAPPAGSVPPLSQPGMANVWNGDTAIGVSNALKPSNWDHLIYAYIIENTRIYDIFSKVLETYMFGEQLETPSPESQLFWRNLEFLIYGDAMPSMVWTTSGRIRRDEMADRMTAYYWMFGMDLSHAPESAAQHPYQRPAAANRDFIPTFEAFAREVWRGIVNAKNISGVNDTDPNAIATLARRLYDMMATRRLNGNLSREEFRAVAIMSFLHLAVSYDSPAVVDLKATASSPEMRLQKIAERVGMRINPKSKPLFDLAGPFSILLQSIESGAFNDAAGAQLLYAPPSSTSRNAETVIDQYTLATGRDLKSQAVSIVSRATTSGMPVQARRALPAQTPPPGAITRPNGAPVPKQA